MTPRPQWPASLAGMRLEKYFHVCAFFSSRDEEYRILLPFIREGLEWGEQALHIWDGQQRSDHITRLKSSGIDTDALLLKGQLQVLGAGDVYLQNGVFDQFRMLETVDAVLKAGWEQGYPRCRIIGHMEWALEGHPGSEDLLEYEVRVNEVLARTQQPAICVYDVERLTAPMLMDILRAHPLSIIGGTIQENPFFTPPEQYLEEIRARSTARRASA